MIAFFYETQGKKIITRDDLRKVGEIVWEDLTLNEICDKIKATPLSSKKVYDYALNQLEEELALKAYKKYKEERFEDISDAKAEAHVRKTLIKKINKEIKLYEELLDNNNGCILTGMWETWNLNYLTRMKKRLQERKFEKRNHKKNHNGMLHYKLDDGSIVTVVKEK